jgi:hypothetical protein
VGFSLLASRTAQKLFGQQHWLYTLASQLIGDGFVDRIERVRFDKAIERQPALLIQAHQIRNELRRHGIALH